MSPCHRARARRHRSGFSAYIQAEVRRVEERAELNAQDQAAGRPATRPVDLDRVHLQRVLRGTAAGSPTEAEWLRNAAMVGFELVPRWGKGGRDVVTGYSVSLADTDSVAIAESKIAPDLTLTSLRKQWAPHETPGDPAGSARAVTGRRGGCRPPRHRR